MFNSEDIKKLIREGIEYRVYEAECLVQTSRQDNLTEILTGLRAMPGITTVTMIGSSKYLSDEKEQSHIKIKFVPLGKSINSYIKNLTIRTRRLAGVYSFQIKSVINYKHKLKKDRERRSRINKIKKM